MPTSTSALPEERSFNNPNPALEIERRSLAPVTVLLGGGGATIGRWIDWRALEGVLRLGLGNEGATICLRGVVALRDSKEGPTVVVVQAGCSWVSVFHGLSSALQEVLVYSAA